MNKNNLGRSWRKISFLLIFTLVLSSFIFMTCGITGDGSWDNPYNIAQAVGTQNSSTKAIQGYIVGQPVATTTVNTSGYTNDYAIALADAADETDTTKMVYVQITTSFRSSFGLKSNPSLLGKAVKVNGSLMNYFSNPGLKNTTAFELVTIDNGGSGDPGTTTPSPYDATYYKDALGKSGEVLKSALHEIIDDHNEISYSAVWDALRYTDKDPNNSNNVIEIYTGRSISKYSNGGLPDQWNREHVWAKSHGDFGTSMGAGTDLHHLRPSDVSVNGARGNLNFDEGGTYHSEATECRYDSDSWEPRDAVKGDVARMLFYMATRYEGDSGEVDLELSEELNSTSAPFHGKLSILLKWNQQDPVDAWEMNRNNIIFENYQHNRNPFIDHPEWITQIWGN